MQNRFKSKVLWMSFGTQILAILMALGVINTGFGETLEMVLIAVLELFVAFGILNNPTSSDTL